MSETTHELIQIIKELTAEIKELKDENESLWMMLDEMRQSDMDAKKLMDQQREDMIAQMLTDIKPVGDA